jgi:hypothetical protein
MRTRALFGFALYSESPAALYVSGAFSALEASFQESVAALARRITWWRFLLVILCFAVNALVVRRLSELDAPWARLSIVALALIPGALLAAILGWRAKLASEA